MIEWCSFRRMIFCIIIFTVISVLVFVLESRLEESVSDGDTVLKKLVAWTSTEVTTAPQHPSNLSHPRNIKLNTSLKGGVTTEESIKGVLPQPLSASQCYLTEPFVVIQECVECSPFEVDALKAQYCMESGYYDRVNCTSSGVTGLRPCYSKGNYATQRFNRLMLSCILLVITSSMFVSWRRSVLDRRAYHRLQQQLDS